MGGVLKALEKPLHQGVDPRLSIIVVRIILAMNIVIGRLVLETEHNVLQKLVRTDIGFPVIFGTDGVFP